ncbi:MAG: hypothetical protein ACRDGA_01035, partial [Bacteroidota bacterium]
PTLWRTSFLTRVLDSGCTTAWEFELRGTRAAVTMEDEILVVAKEPRPIQILYSAVSRNEWCEGALNWLNRVGIAVTPMRAIKAYQPGQRWPKVK